ncbi:MAPK/MAK/MRK overlapping kinase isoform X1 [Lemur catta]|nr:MAPK/MAK/MRK overlapping kinase isoform X1 [Lemur catta]
MKMQSLRDGNYYACKQMKQRFESIEQVNNLREIQALRRLHPHPNILTLHEVVFDRKSGSLALICELMDMNIYELIRGRRHPLSEKKIMYYMYQLCKSLDHMHRNGIFHRDVKPENILIKQDVLKLGDFGSCRSVYSKQPYTEYISTRWYRAPECLLTDGFYTYKMDLWSAGCVFYEIASLQPLFPGANELDQISKIHDVIGTPAQKTLTKFKQSRAMSFDFPFKKGSGIPLLTTNLSPQCLSLLHSMVAYDPDERITARQALQHPYFQEQRATEKQALASHRRACFPEHPVAAEPLRAGWQMSKEGRKQVPSPWLPRAFPPFSRSCHSSWRCPSSTTLREPVVAASPPSSSPGRDTQMTSQPCPCSAAPTSWTEGPFQTFVWCHSLPGPMKVPTVGHIRETVPKARGGPSQGTRTGLHNGTAQTKAFRRYQAVVLLQPHAAVSVRIWSRRESPGAEAPEVCWCKQEDRSTEGHESRPETVSLAHHREERWRVLSSLRHLSSMEGKAGHDQGCPSDTGLRRRLAAGQALLCSRPHHRLELGPEPPASRVGSPGSSCTVCSVQYVCKTTSF